MKTLGIIFFIVFMVFCMISIASSLLFKKRKRKLKEELEREIRENTDLTKEQHIELCELIEELKLEKK